MQLADDATLWRHTVLCSLVLGGAEIFTLERMLAAGDAPELRCNTSLNTLIRQDPRYDPIDVQAIPALDALASNINWRNLTTASAA